MLTVNWSFNSAINFSTSISGADAPEEIPIVLHPLILSIGTGLSECINSAELQPEFLATSTNLTELDEFLLPIIKNISHLSAISLTADCLFVVA